MTRAEARALLAFESKIMRACHSLERQLVSPSERQYAQTYYLATIRGCVDGKRLGSAPTMNARRMLTTGGEGQ